MNNSYYYKTTSKEEKERIHHELNANWPELYYLRGFILPDRNVICYDPYVARCFMPPVYWISEDRVGNSQPVSLDEFFTLIEMSQL